jgi:hypothetical protein
MKSSVLKGHTMTGLDWDTTKYTEKGSSSMTDRKGRRTKELCRSHQRFHQEGRMQVSKENSQEIERIQEEYYRRMTPPRRSRIQNQQPAMERNQGENYRRTTPFKRSPRYQTIFLGLCYSCNNFGHKDYKLQILC